ncbi:hypothetical protein J2W97_001744 [Paenibacillus jamilae]|nr:hypothetical protein [Paenibacillus jamilae]
MKVGWNHDRIFHEIVLFLDHLVVQTSLHKGRSSLLFSGYSTGVISIKTLYIYNPLRTEEEKTSKKVR